MRNALVSAIILVFAVTPVTFSQFPLAESKGVSVGKTEAGGGWGGAENVWGDSDLAAVISGNNRLALDLYSKLSEQGGNLFFSPSSISTSLALAYGGARGKTAQQLAAVLHLTLGQERLHQAFAALNRGLNGGGSAQAGYRLTIANALWGQKDYSFLESFIRMAKDNYDVGLKQVDFSNSPEAAQAINAWVEGKTQKAIKELFKPNAFDQDTRLVLTNAIHFKGEWASRFDPRRTSETPFWLAAEQKVMVPMMHQSGKFKAISAEDAQAIELPYAGKDLSMIVFLPQKIDGLAEFEHKLTPEKLDEWLSKLRKNEEHQISVVALPKFMMDTEFELSGTLSQMGMPLAFGGSADFSGMAVGDELQIDKVLHKAFVEVNEEGTEAAAATGVQIRSRSLDLNMFVIDHPFLFLIRDNRSGGIIFMGRVTDPRG
jgi:serine protease inhibitor